MAANINASENTLEGAAENMVTTLAATPCQSASFTNLPVELKECIYLYAIAMDEHYVPSSTPFVSNALGYAIFSHRLPAMCFTSKLEHAIALRTIFRHATVSLLDRKDKVLLLQRLRNCATEQGVKDMFATLANLELNYVQRSSLSGLQSDLTFAQRCVHVRNLTLTMLHISLSCADDTQPLALTWGRLGYRRLTCTEIVHKFELARVVKLA
jgi:hypothetical protein